MYVQPTTPPVIANLFDREGKPLVAEGETVAVRFTRHWAFTIVAEIDTKHQRVRALSHKAYEWSKEEQWQTANATQRRNILDSGLVNSFWYNTWGLVLSPRTWKPLRRETWDAGNLCRLTDEVKTAMERCAAWSRADALLGDLHNLSATDDVAEVNFLAEQTELLIQRIIRRREGGRLQGNYTYLRNGRYVPAKEITTL